MKKAEKAVLAIFLLTVVCALLHMTLGIVSILRACAETSFPWTAACFFTMLYFGPPALIELIVYILIKIRKK